MFDKELIKREIDKLPEDVLGEVLDNEKGRGRRSEFKCTRNLSLIPVY